MCVLLYVQKPFPFVSCPAALCAGFGIWACSIIVNRSAVHSRFSALFVCLHPSCVWRGSRPSLSLSDITEGASRSRYACVRQVITASVKGFADCFSSPHGRHSRKTIPQGKAHSPVPICHRAAAREKPVAPVGAQEGKTHYHKELIKSQPDWHGRGLVAGAKSPGFTSEGNAICLCAYLKGSCGQKLKFQAIFHSPFCPYRLWWHFLVSLTVLEFYSWRQEAFLLCVEIRQQFYLSIYVCTVTFQTFYPSSALCLLRR